MVRHRKEKGTEYQVPLNTDTAPASLISLTRITGAISTRDYFFGTRELKPDLIINWSITKYNE